MTAGALPGSPLAPRMSAVMGEIRKKLRIIGPRRRRLVDCLFDTGATWSFVRPDLVAELGLSTAKVPGGVSIRLGKGSTRVSRVAAVKIRLDGVSLPDHAYVMAGLPEPYVVGIEFLEAYGIRLDPRRRRLLLPPRRRLRVILV